MTETLRRLRSDIETKNEQLDQARREGARASVALGVAQGLAEELRAAAADKDAALLAATRCARCLAPALVDRFLTTTPTLRRPCVRLASHPLPPPSPPHATLISRAALLAEELARAQTELAALGRQERLAAEMSAMKDEIEALRRGAAAPPPAALLDAAAEEVSAQRARIAVLEAELQRLQVHERRAAMLSQRDLEEARSASAAEVARLQDDAARAAAASQAQLSAAIAEKETAVLALQKQLAGAERAAETAAAEVAELQRALAAAEVVAESLQLQVSQWANEKQTLTALLKTALTAAPALQEQLAAAQAEAARARDDLQAAQNDAQTKAGVIAVLESKIDAVNADVEAYTNAAGAVSTRRSPCLPPLSCSPNVTLNFLNQERERLMTQVQEQTAALQEQVLQQQIRDAQHADRLALAQQQLEAAAADTAAVREAQVRPII